MTESYMMLSYTQKMCIFCNILMFVSATYSDPNEPIRTCALGQFDKVPVNNCSLPVCTGEQLGRPVSADICDPRRCTEFPVEEFENLGPMYPYVWNIGKKVIVGCPYNVSHTYITEVSDGTLKFDQSDYTATGTSCSEPIHYVYQYTSPSKLSKNGKFKSYISHQGNQTWETCYPLWVPGGPYIHRRCRLDPPPPPGQGYATVIVLQTIRSHEDYERNEKIIQKYLKHYKFDWTNITTDCF